MSKPMPDEPKHTALPSPFAWPLTCGEETTDCGIEAINRRGQLIRKKARMVIVDADGNDIRLEHVTAEERDFIIRAVNSHAAMVEALQTCAVELGRLGGNDRERRAAIRKAIAALALAEQP